MKAALLALLVLTACSSASAGAAFTRTAGHVIFVSDRDGDNDIYGISGDGRRVAALTRNRLPEASVVISPTGNWIGETRGSSAGVLISGDGRRELRLPGRPDAFSADGRLVALETGTSPNWGIATIRSNGRGLRRFGPGVPIEFSPGRRFLSFWEEGTAGVGVVDLATGRRTIVIDETPLDIGYVWWSPSWSKVAWVRRVSANFVLADELVVRARTTPDARPTVLRHGVAPGRVSWLDENRLLVDDSVIRIDGTVAPVFGKYARDVTASPRKNAVAYYEWNDPENRTDPTLFLAAVDGSPTSAVHLTGSPSGLAWSPSGRFVAVAVQTRSGSALGFVDIARLRVTRTVRLPSRVDRLTWSPDDATVLVERVGAREIVIASRSGWVRRVRTHGNTQVIGWMKGPLAR